MNTQSTSRALRRFMGDVQIRSASDLDRRSCAELYWLMLEEEAGEQWDRARFPAVSAWIGTMLDEGNPAIMVVELEDKVIGQVMLALDQVVPLAPPRMMAFSLFVRPEYRDGRAAMALIRTAVAVAEEFGAALECIVVPDSANARFYEEVGAKNTGLIYRLEVPDV